jgi:hypothetical protein
VTVLEDGDLADGQRRGRTRALRAILRGDRSAEDQGRADDQDGGGNGDGTAQDAPPGCTGVWRCAGAAAVTASSRHD